LLLLFIVIYSVAVIIIVSLSMKDMAVVFNEADEVGLIRKQYYDGLIRTCITVFQCIAGGIDWATAAYALTEVGLIYMDIVFLLYVAFVVFAIMNIVTGVFVDQAMKAVQDDWSMVIQEVEDKRKKIITKFYSVCDEILEWNGNSLSWLDMERLIGDRKVRGYFKQLDLDPWDLRTFFKILLRENGNMEDKSVDMDQFIHGCVRLRGSAKNIDLVALRCESFTNSRNMQELFSKLDDLHTRLEAITKSSGGRSSAGSRHHHHHRVKSLPLEYDGQEALAVGKKNM